MKISHFLCALAITLIGPYSFAGWNDSSPQPVPHPSPYQPCNGPCNTDTGWNDRSPQPVPHPSPYQPCDANCMKGMLGGFNDKN